MSDPVKSPAWLEKPDGTRADIEGNCSIGRAAGNQVILADDRVSRRHAVIHAQGEGEFWLVDLGTSNGSYVNGRRLSQPGRLNHGDVIKIGSLQLVFREAGGRGRDISATTTASDQTIVAVESSPCWLLLVDIEGSTHLSQKLEPEALAILIGRWFALDGIDAVASLSYEAPAKQRRDFVPCRTPAARPRAHSLPRRCLHRRFSAPPASRSVASRA